MLDSKTKSSFYNIIPASSFAGFIPKKEWGGEEDMLMMKAVKPRR